MRVPIRAIAAIAGVALLAGACGSDDGAADAEPGSGGEEAAGPSSSDGGPVAGITEDTITLGYTQIDFDQLREQMSVDLNYQNAEPVLEALVAEINDSGGVAGRELVVEVGTYLPVGAASADELCIRFTEDDPVFAVLGGFMGPGAVDVNPCITTQHDTILIGGTWTEAQQAEASAPWLRVDMTTARRSVGFARALGEQGQLDDVDAIAVIGGPDAEPYLPEVEEALAGSGTDVVLTTTFTGGEAELRPLLERATASGADAVFYSGLNPALLPTFADYDLRYFFDDAATTEGGMRDFTRSGGDLDVVSNGTYPKPFTDDERLAECIDIVEERTDIVVADPNTLGDDEPDWWEAVSRACENLRLFQDVVAAVDGELTNASFLAAAESLGEIELPGVARGSLGPGKYDASDTTTLVEWSPEEADGDGGWVPLGDPIVID